MGCFLQGLYCGEGNKGNHGRYIDVINMEPPTVF